MRAIVQDRYGSPDVLELRELDEPAVSEHEVLVRVRAAAVNAYDWHVMRGDPYLARLAIGLRRPKAPIRGRDFAGRVEAVGREVTRFKPGDEVYGDLGTADGAFADYVSAPEDQVESKPSTLTFEQAAAAPLAGVTALMGLREVGRVQPGQRVLVNGASGGVGTFAVQLARAFGAEVTGVCSTRNLDLVRSLGADQVVDYTREDFTLEGRRQDLVLDLVGNRSLADLRRALTPGGRWSSPAGGCPARAGSSARSRSSSRGGCCPASPATGCWCSRRRRAGRGWRRCEGWSSPGRSPPSSTGPTPCARRQRPSATSSGSTRGQRS
jgi:NADPH:quinone reductase-like Zn-dependent oxidoreductase